MNFFKVFAHHKFYNNGKEPRKHAPDYQCPQRVRQGHTHQKAPERLPRHVQTERELDHSSPQVHSNGRVTPEKARPTAKNTSSGSTRTSRKRSNAVNFWSMSSTTTNATGPRNNK